MKEFGGYCLILFAPSLKGAKSGRVRLIGFQLGDGLSWATWKNSVRWRWLIHFII